MKYSHHIIVNNISGGQSENFFVFQKPPALSSPAWSATANLVPPAAPTPSFSIPSFSQIISGIDPGRGLANVIPSTAHSGEFQPVPVEPPQAALHPTAQMPASQRTPSVSWEQSFGFDASTVTPCPMHSGLPLSCNSCDESGMVSTTFTGFQNL